MKKLIFVFALLLSLAAQAMDEKNKDKNWLSYVTYKKNVMRSPLSGASKWFETLYQSKLSPSIICLDKELKIMQSKTYFMHDSKTFVLCGHQDCKKVFYYYFDVETKNQINCTSMDYSKKKAKAILEKENRQNYSLDNSWNITLEEKEAVMDYYKGRNKYELVLTELSKLGYSYAETIAICTLHNFHYTHEQCALRISPDERTIFAVLGHLILVLEIPKKDSL